MPPVLSSCSDSGGCTVIVCDAWSRNFTCGYPANCATGEDTFIMDGGQSIVLRPTQVALLQPNDSPSAVTLAPTDILSVDPAVKAPGTAGTVTAYATTTARSAPSIPENTACGLTNSTSSEGGFTAGQVAGASVGTGIPLLCGLGAACFIIFRQRKKLNATRNDKDRQSAASSQHQPPAEQPLMATRDQWWHQPRPSHNWSASTHWSPTPANNISPSTTPGPNARPNEMDALYSQKVEMDAERDPGELEERH